MANISVPEQVPAPKAPWAMASMTSKSRAALAALMVLSWAACDKNDAPVPSVSQSIENQDSSVEVFRDVTVVAGGTPYIEWEMMFQDILIVDGFDTSKNEAPFRPRILGWAGKTTTGLGMNNEYVGDLYRNNKTWDDTFTPTKIWKEIWLNVPGDGTGEQ